ncbi:MAG TPA: trypsin-like peptidase domain-containing protein [Pirellulales bacterium]|nr:trypsin-like peptidase domain-containing protein [Pirellulales bacterium]
MKFDVAMWPFSGNAAGVRAFDVPTRRDALPSGARLNVVTFVVCAISLFTTTSMYGAELVTVTLVGGAKVTAPLLRENEEGVVLDLGNEVLNFPKKSILAIDHDAKGAKSKAPAQRDIFSAGRLEAADLPTLVRNYGDAVVMVKSAAGRGSGFIISRHGHLITNYHVVEGHTKLQVTLFRRTDTGYEKHELKKVKIVALQPLRDLALLQLDVSEIPGEMPKPVVLDDRDDLRVGDLIFAIGNPLGLERSVTQGIVSSTTRTIGHLRLIQTDASINPGNSGGPLFNARGEIVGVVCAGATSFDGLAFGIPASDLVDFLIHRETYLYDSAQPQNGVTYLAPPYRAPESEKTAAEKNGDKKNDNDHKQPSPSANTKSGAKPPKNARTDKPKPQKE